MKKQYVRLVDGNGNSRVRAIKAGLDIETAIASLEQKGYQVQRVKSPPSIKTMERWMSDAVAKATDGCWVEPDGVCIHGHKSWLMELGYI